MEQIASGPAVEFGCVGAAGGLGVNHVEALCPEVEGAAVETGFCGPVDEPVGAGRAGEVGRVDAAGAGDGVDLLEADRVEAKAAAGEDARLGAAVEGVVARRVVEPGDVVSGGGGMGLDLIEIVDLQEGVGRLERGPPIAQAEGSLPGES